MHRILDLIENMGGMFNHISLQVGKVCKMISKRIKEVLSLTLTHSTGDDLIDYKIYGNSEQRNYTSKNLFNENTIYSSLTKEGDVFSGNAIAVNNVKYYIPQELVGKTLTFSAYLKTINTTNLRVGFNGTFNGTLINNTDDFGRSVLTFTPTATTEYINITYGNSPDTIYFKDIQLELGSTATTYEPYLVTPSPETPSDVISLGEPKNLNYENLKGYATAVNGEWHDDNRYTTSLANVVAGKTYTISQGNAPTVSYLRYGQWDTANSTYISVVPIATAERIASTFTFTPDFTGVVAFNWRLNDTIEYTPVNVQIERGTVATSYEPYRQYNQIDVITSGKNLFDINNSTLTNATKNDDGSITLNVNNSFYATALFTNELKNKIASSLGHTFTLSTKNGISGKRLNIVIQGTRSGGQTYQEAYTPLGGREVSITVATDFTSISSVELRFGRSSDRYTDTTTIVEDIQLEEGSVVTDYEQYQGEPITTTIDLTSNEELRSIGDISDYIDYTNNVIVRKIGKHIFTGSETFVNNLSSSGDIRYNCSNKAFGTANLSCDRFELTSSTTGFQHEKIRGTDTSIRIVFYPSEDITTIEEWIAWLIEQNEAGTPVIVYYELETPVNEPINNAHEPLRKVGDVSDYIDYDKGKIIRNIYKYVFTGAEDISSYPVVAPDVYGFNLWQSNNLQMPLASTSHAIVCTHLPTIESLGKGYVIGVDLTVTSSNFYMRFGVPYQSIKTWLAEQYTAGTPVIIYYQLETPVEEDITLPAIPTVEGTTYLEVNNKPTASNMYCKYYGTE